MPTRPLLPLLAVLLLAAPACALAQTAAPPVETPGRPPRARPDRSAQPDPTVQRSAARERQRACGAEWRALKPAEKAEKGPKWPQYYSKCVRRLREQKA